MQSGEHDHAAVKQVSLIADTGRILSSGWDSAIVGLTFKPPMSDVLRASLVFGGTGAPWCLNAWTAVHFPIGLQIQAKK